MHNLYKYIFIMIFALFSFLDTAQSEDKKLLGKITKVTYEASINQVTLNIEGFAHNGELWLAITYWAGKNFSEYNLEPIRVSGKFFKKVTIPITIEQYQYFIVSGENMPYAANLWAKKIDSQECVQNNGTTCEYCAKCGFHMEKKVDSYQDECIIN